MNYVTSEILFEKFEIIECFKKDEHASVYLADHIYLGKKIILKALNTKTIFDESKVERFKREAKIMAKLEHPNIIKVLDFGTYNEYFYISFEYFESKNLRSLLKDKSLTPKQKKDLIVQLFKGLGYAHQNQIIHRDIKPENILVNDNLELKIGDFGLALALNDSFVTSQYSIVGTPCYMSPEQVQGGKLTSRSDLFSAGILALELFTGKNPFLGEDVNQTISNVINFDPDAIEPLVEQLPIELREVLLKLLIKKADRRYNSAEEVLKNLSVPLSEIKIVPWKFFKNKQTVYASTAVIFIITTFVIVNQLDFGNNNTDKLEPISTDQMDAFISKDAIEDNKKNDGDALNEPGKNIPNEVNAEDNNLAIAEDDFPPEDFNSESKSEEENSAVLFGSLLVECIPWAHIYLNDRRLETTPLTDPIDLRAGIYDIRLSHPNYPEYNQQIKILPNETTSLTINLDTLYGYFVCNIFPWGDVYINDEFLGQTPFSEPLKLRPGTHELAIKNPNFPELTESIVIEKNDTLRLQINLNESVSNKLRVNN